MLGQSVPAAVRALERKRRQEQAAAVAAVGRIWKRMGEDFTESFLAIAPSLIEVTNTAQGRVAEIAAEAVPTALAATGQARADVPRWEIATRQWVGTAGDGMPTETLLYGAVTTAKTAVAEGASTAQALGRGGRFLSLAVGTLLSDTARGVAGAATYARPVGGYVRMLNPPSCGRCVILAGKWFRANQGFERHPDCDCLHIPVAESLAGDLTVDSRSYLDSLDDKALAKALGSRANALAYRDYGGDPIQLVNAYRHGRGIRTAQVYGRTVKYTLEGTTVRGYAASQMRRVHALSALAKTPGSRHRHVVAPRLMPESIFAMAQSQSHAQRLLRDHGWLDIR